MKAPRWRGAPLVGCLAIAASAWAYGVIFWMEWPPLRGEQPSALWVGAMALVEGIGLAFHRAMLPLHLLLAGRLEAEVQGRSTKESGVQGPLWRLGLCLLGFGPAFVLGISGWPRVLSQPLYAYAKGIAWVAGGVLILGGLVASVEVMASRGRGRNLGSIPGNWKGLLDVAAGLALGLALYHDMDPTYDSVFFATGTAVAASHAAVTVAAFVLAAGATILAVAWGVLHGASVSPAFAVLPYGLRFLGTVGTLAVGILLATGRYESFAAMLGLHQ